MATTGIVKRMAAQIDQAAQFQSATILSSRNSIEQKKENGEAELKQSNTPDLLPVTSAKEHSWIRLQVGHIFGNLATSSNQFFDDFVKCTQTTAVGLKETPALILEAATADDAVKQLQSALSGSSSTLSAEYLLILDGNKIHKSTVRKTMVKSFGDQFIIYHIHAGKATTCLQGRPNADDQLKALVSLFSQFTLRKKSTGKVGDASPRPAPREISPPTAIGDTVPKHRNYQAKQRHSHPQSASNAIESGREQSPFRLPNSEDSPLNRSKQTKATSRSSLDDDSKFSPSDYVKVEKLGEGAFGVVFKCYDKNTLRLFVAKETIFRSSNVLAAAQNEVDRIKELDHPKIIKYFGCASKEDQVVIFMEYLPGGSLKQAMDKCGPIAEKTAICYIEQIIEGMCYIHSKGIIHGDLKCDNLLLDGQGGVKLGDFGIAMKKSLNSLNQSFFSQTSLGGGTLYWLAPEIHFQQTFGRSADVWSLGCTIVEILTTRPPYSNYSVPTFFASLGSNQLTYNVTELIPQASNQMTRFVSRLLVIDNTKRLHTGAEVAAAFRTEFKN